jgi:hypothetical protein
VIVFWTEGEERRCRMCYEDRERERERERELSTRGMDVAIESERHNVNVFFLV